MLLSEYQKKALETALPTALSFDYLVPGLVAEVGEVFGVVAKAVRDEWSEERLQAELKAELGDVCWFLVLLAHMIEEEFEVASMEAWRKPDKKYSLVQLHEDAYEIMSTYSGIYTSISYLELFYAMRSVINVASGYGLDLTDVLEYNINKLQSRKERGSLKGSGNDR